MSEIGTQTPIKENNMNAPELMPLLRQGTGATPADGGCLVQVASYLHDGSWVDDTPCVHPVLRSLAICVNDLTPDGERHRLAIFAPDLIGTGPGPNGREGRVLAVRLSAWCARQVLDLAPDRGAALKAIGAAEGWCDGTVSEQECRVAADAAYNAADAARAAAYAAYAAANAPAAAANAAAYAADYACADLRTLLAGAITEYRRLTGHTPDPIDPAKWDEVCELIGAHRG